MGKKKGNKKGGYDDDIWADDLIEDPIAAAEAKTAEDDNDDDMGGGGGLMNMISRAKKNKKGKKNAPTPSFAALAVDDDVEEDDEEEDEEPAQAATPAAASEDELDAPQMASKKNKKKKGKGGASTPQPLDLADEPTDEPVVVIKSAKQKEREKKERAKLLKKQKADEAKAKKEAELRELEAALGTAKIEDDKPAAEDDAAEGGASKKNKKKKAKKGKKGGDDEDDEAAAAPAPAAAPAKKEKEKGGKKKKGAPIAALQKMVEEQRRREEEMRKAHEEEMRRIEEEERRIAEEEARIEAEREAKREADRLRREQLKKEGKLLTKKQKEAKARQEKALEALMASGAQIAGLAEREQAGEAGAKSGGRRGGHREAEERKRRAAERKKKEEEEERKRKEEEEAARKKAEEDAEEESDDDAGDDWEALLESSEDEDKDDDEKKASDDEDDDVKDSWDQSSDEEEEEVAVKKPAAKAAPAAKGKAPAKPAESESESESESDSGSDSDDSSDYSSSEEEMTAAERQVYERKQAAAARRKQRMEDAKAARSADNLRSPICCILGHVDTGKCFGFNTPLLMADGTTRFVQDIKENELLMGDDCTPRQVRAGSLVHEQGQLYRITPDSASGAESFVCNGEHILVLINLTKPWVEGVVAEDGSDAFAAKEVYIDDASNKPSVRVVGQFATEAEALAALPAWSLDIWQVPVLDFLATNTVERSRWLMYTPEHGVEYPADAVEPITLALREVFGEVAASEQLEQLAFWRLGLWLAAAQETKAQLGAEVAAKVQEFASAVTADGAKLESLVSRLGVSRTAAIPDVLMRSSKDNRRALLAGLVDAAGVYSAGVARDVRGTAVSTESWELRSQNSDFAASAKKLARSVGLEVGAVTEIEAGAVWSIKLSGPAMQQVSGLVQLESKRVSTKAQDQWLNCLFSSSPFVVANIGEGDYYGFTVSGPNSRFLLGDFTVTHNTKLLDKIRQTNVQAGEAGGITQQIGATYFPAEAIKEKTASINTKGKLEINVPGLLIIDTPGHESFTNLRSRGSSLCNIAILVVDIMHGLEPQTLESLRLLRDRKTPFIVALNKIDRIYDWKAIPNSPFRASLKTQPQHSQREFAKRLADTITAFAEQGLNSCVYYENKNVAKYVSLVPTSAISGEGIPDILGLLVGLTQSRMANELMYLSELECTVLEVKVVEGLGTTIDVVLSNGVLHEGDRIVVCGLDGPIVTNVRALLTPQPMRELRVKSAYIHHKSIKAAMGVKITAPGLERAIAGSRLMVVGPDDDEEELMDEIMSDLTSLNDAIDKSGRGVWVQASTLGSLEALLEFLRVSKIPVSGINIGPVHKKDVTRASAMLEKAKEFAVMLCFDVKVDKDAEELADEFGVKVFKADIIYHLFDAFTAYNEEIMEQKRKDQAPQAIFPCTLKMIKGAAFNKRDPLIIGCDVIEGQLRQGTPMCVAKWDPETKTREIINLGKVSSMEINHKQVDIVRKGEAGAGVAVRIDCPVYDTPKMYGRHFTDDDEIYSRITRGSIDVLKESFRNDLNKEEWALVIKLKKILDVN